MSKQPVLTVANGGLFGNYIADAGHLWVSKNVAFKFGDEVMHCGQTDWKIYGTVPESEWDTQRWQLFAYLDKDGEIGIAILADGRLKNGRNNGRAFVLTMSFPGVKTAVQVVSAMLKAAELSSAKEA